MLSCLIAAAFQQSAIAVPTFSSWDGKSWASIAVGTTEKDLKKQVKTAKTVEADPASIRILADKKGWVVTGVLTDVNNKGTVAGFTVGIEKDEAIESLEALREELGQPDFSAFPRLRYSDWSVAIWKEKGIAAVVRGGSRPIVQKVLLAPYTVLLANLDLWDRNQNDIRDFPRIPVTGFSVSATVEPRDSTMESVIRDDLRRNAGRLMRSYDGPGWFPSRRDGRSIDVTMRIRRKESYSIDGSVSVSYKDDLGDLSVSESGSAMAKREIEVSNQVGIMFDDLMKKVARSIDDKYRRLAWQAEWRPFLALAKPRP